MTQRITFLDVGDVLRSHERMIAEFGGMPGVRDHGLLQSAVHLPQAQFGGKHLHEGVPEMAAAYLCHICCNHPLVDGSKRTALASAEMFVVLNSYLVRATNQELETTTRSVAAGQVSKQDETLFVQSHLVAIR